MYCTAQGNSCPQKKSTAVSRSADWFAAHVLFNDAFVGYQCECTHVCYDCPLSVIAAFIDNQVFLFATSKRQARGHGNKTATEKYNKAKFNRHWSPEKKQLIAANMCCMFRCHKQYSKKKTRNSKRKFYCMSLDCESFSLYPPVLFRTTRLRLITQSMPRTECRKIQFRSVIMLTILSPASYQLVCIISWIFWL